MRYLPAEIEAALSAVIEYCWDDELKDATDQLAENGNIGNHVFRHLVALDNWLRGADYSPEYYCTENGNDGERVTVED